MLWSFLCNEVGMDWVSFFICFFVGGLAYHVLSYIIEIGQLALYIKEAEKNALLMLANSAQSISFIQTIKYRAMKEAGIEESVIIRTKKIDDYNFEAWKNAAISNLLAAYPEHHKALTRYVNWEEAMNVLDDIYHNKPKREK